MEWLKTWKVPPGGITRGEACRLVLKHLDLKEIPEGKVEEFHRLLVDPVMLKANALIKQPLTEMKHCDFCKHEGKEHFAIIDGRLKQGTSWAYFCDAHWHKYGVGRLGLGLGAELRFTKEVADEMVRIATERREEEEKKWKEMLAEMGITDIPERKFVANFLSPTHQWNLPGAVAWKCYCLGDGFGKLSPSQLRKINDGWDWSHIRDSTDEAILKITETICQHFRISHWSEYDKEALNRLAIRETKNIEIDVDDLANLDFED